jgi:hypothetical protein
MNISSPPTEPSSISPVSGLLSADVYETRSRTNSQITSRYRIGNAGGDRFGRLFMPVVRSAT